MPRHLHFIFCILEPCLVLTLILGIDLSEMNLELIHCLSGVSKLEQRLRLVLTGEA